MTKGIKKLVVLLMLTFLSNLASANTVEEYIQNARINANQGNLEAAAVLYQKALKLEENNLTARKELANVLLEAQLNDNYSEQNDVQLAALNEIKPGVPYSPLHFPLYYLSNVALDSKDKLDKSLHADFLLALTQLQKGDNESAIKTAHELQKKSPKHPVPLNLLGLAFAAKGETIKAREAYEEALSLKEDFHAARMNLAELEMRLADYPQARKVMNEILKTEKNNRRAFLLMAKLSELEGNTSEALQWYQKTSKNY